MVFDIMAMMRTEIAIFCQINIYTFLLLAQLINKSIVNFRFYWPGIRATSK